MLYGVKRLDFYGFTFNIAAGREQRAGAGAQGWYERGSDERRGRAAWVAGKGVGITAVMAPGRPPRSAGGELHRYRIQFMQAVSGDLLNPSPCPSPRSTPKSLKIPGTSRGPALPQAPHCISLRRSALRLVSAEQRRLHPVAACQCEQMLLRIW